LFEQRHDVVRAVGQRREGAPQSQSG
jgi:hypothetical protein